MGKSYSFREIQRILLDHDKRFTFQYDRGKGGHFMIYHPDIDGRPESFPVSCHGRNNDLRPYVVPDIIKRFKLPKDLFR